VRLLIVNGDDFGAGRGVNHGILYAHRHGILTSASLMVNMPGSEEAARIAGLAPKLSVGLHVNLTNEGGAPVVDLEDPEACRLELDRQLARFRRLLGRLPTHIDAHHNIHRRELLAPLFAALARRHALPLREHSGVRYYSSFYGQWGGETHLEQVSPESLQRMLREEIGDGVTELACHPGLPDPDFSSEYDTPREAEVRTLCDPALRETLVALGFRLIGYGELSTAIGGSNATRPVPCRPS